jgi:hypothetical protein
MNRKARRRLNKAEKDAPKQPKILNSSIKEPIDFPLKAIDTPFQKFPALKVYLLKLRDQHEEHVRVTQDLILADNGALHLTDHYLYGVLQRSLNLLHGFVAMVSAWNYNAAAPIARQQIDTLMRLHYTANSGKSSEITTALLAGESFRNLRDKAGVKLHDARLQELCKDTFPWISLVYEELCGVTHFSGKHLHSPISNVDQNTSQVTINIAPGTYHWKEAEIKDLLEMFECCTRQILRLCQAYVDDKNSGVN